MTEPGVIVTLAILLALCCIVALDEYLSFESELGEEWDFTQPYRKK